MRGLLDVTKLDSHHTVWLAQMMKTTEEVYIYQYVTRPNEAIAVKPPFSFSEDEEDDIEVSYVQHSVSIELQNRAEEKDDPAFAYQPGP